MLDDAIKKIQEALLEGETAIIKSPSNRFYLTGFNSSDGVIFISQKKAVFLTDSRYFEKAKATVKACETELLLNFISQALYFCEEQEIKKVFLETDYISVGAFEGYKKAFEGVEVLSDTKITDLLLNLRSVKSVTELKNIELAQKLTDDTFSYILERIEKGRSEKEIMLDMEFFMRKQGSEGVAFDFIVVSGKNSSLPHGVPTDKKIENGDFITMDFGAVINGYRSDMTRTVAVGSVTDEQKKVYETVLEAQTEALKAIKSGAVCKDIDKVARDIIDKEYKDCFGHGLGHSVGIEIHESPAFNTRCETVLKPQMVMTVEPGIYLENKFGVRIEDMVFVTENGHKNITKSDKKLIVL